MNPISEFFEIEKLKETIKKQSEIIEYYRHGFQAQITGMDPNNWDNIKSAWALKCRFGPEIHDYRKKCKKLSTIIASEMADIAEGTSDPTVWFYF